jgi:hypothetical protein
MTEHALINLSSLAVVSGGQQAGGLTRAEHDKAFLDGGFMGGLGGAITGAVWGAGLGVAVGGFGAIPGAMAGAFFGAAAGGTAGAVGNVALQKWHARGRAPAG